MDLEHKWWLNPYLFYLAEYERVTSISFRLICPEIENTWSFPDHHTLGCVYISGKCLRMCYVFARCLQIPNFSRFCPAVCNSTGFLFFFLFYLSFVSKGLCSKILLYCFPESAVYTKKEVGTYRKDTFCSLIILLLCMKSVLLMLYKDKVSRRYLLESIHLFIFYHPISIYFITKADRPSF